MKPARLAILGLAILAGGAAAMIAGRSSEPEQVVVAAPPVPMARVLVAAQDVALGSALAATDLRFQDWPVAAVNPAYITDKASPDAVKDWTGAIARASFVSGEPIRPQKLIKGAGSGYLSAILPAGMRAVATRIAVDTAAGGFILPNDHVDVLLTRRDVGTDNGKTGFSTQTILRNVRVLAIDQQVEEQNGQKVITGSTATLELPPQQTEVLTMAREMGTLSLSLRSLADGMPSASAGPELGGDLLGPPKPSSGVAVVRYGVPSLVTDR